jgi:hypothetical protein
MRVKGLISILPLIIFLIVVALGIGSFFYTHPNFKFSDLYNIGTPNTTPPPPEVTVDKSTFAKGELLVTFTSGTTYKQAKDFFAQANVSDYQDLAWISSGTTPQDSTILGVTDIFKVIVPEGSEVESANSFKANPIINSATPNYVEKSR